MGGGHHTHCPELFVGRVTSKCEELKGGGMCGGYGAH